MSKIRNRAAGESLAYDRLQKLLASSGSLNNLQIVVNRVFQKAPDIVKEMENEIEGLSTSRKKSCLVDLVLHKIKELLIDDASLADEFRLPTKVWHYLAYIDLVVARIKDNTKQWATYVLRDFPYTDHEGILIEEEGYHLRTKLKTALKEIGFACGVQTEIEENRIWFRITTSRKTKDRKKDMDKVFKARPTFVIYYPGEPYFYSVSNLPDHLANALATCMGCRDSKQIPLTGRCVESLRRLRLGRDGRDGPKNKATLDTERFTVFGNGTGGVTTTEQHQPILDKVTVSCQAELDVLNEKLDITLEAVGEDVIGGLLDLVELGVIEKPAPMWVANLPTAGRNKFHLREGGRAAVAGRDIDTESVLTVM